MKSQIEFTLILKLTVLKLEGLCLAFLATQLQKQLKTSEHSALEKRGWEIKGLNFGTKARTFTESSLGL